VTRRRTGRLSGITPLVCAAVTAVVGVSIVVVLTGCSVIWGRTVPLRPTITQQQAEEQTDQYIRDIVALLPGTPKLEPGGFPLVSEMTCDDADDGGPRGRVTVTRDYWVRYPWNEDPPNNTEIFNKLYAYWTGRGYQIRHDEHNAPASRDLDVENPKDGFRMGIQEAINGQLSIGASSPCVWPGGTPSPKDERR